MDQKTTNFILKLAVSVLAGVVGIVVITMMIGIFMPNEQVSNDKIFEMIGPAFNTVIGAFVGLLGGLSLNGDKKEVAPPSPPAPQPAEEKAEEDDGIDHSQPIPEEEHKDDNRWSDDHHDEHLADHVAKHS